MHAKTTVLIRKAKITEAKVLTDLTVRSKAYWGYAEEFMEACIGELAVPKEKLKNDKYSYMVAESKGELVGYYGLEPITDMETELTALFIEPNSIGKGLGKKLLVHAVNAALESGARELTLQADPNAEGFYLANGGIQIGKRESERFPGRYVTTFSISLQRYASKKWKMCREKS